MGSWTMVINGHGIHDNGKPEDADAMLAEFVASLRAAGHAVEASHLTIGAGRTWMPVTELEAPGEGYAVADQQRNW